MGIGLFRLITKIRNFTGRALRDSQLPKSRVFGIWLLPIPSISRSVTGEDKVARSLRVAGEAGFHQPVIAKCSVAVEVTEPPAPRRGVLFRVLNLKLNIRGGAGNERLVTPEDFVVFFGWHVLIVHSG